MPVVLAPLASKSGTLKFVPGSGYLGCATRWFDKTILSDGTINSAAHIRFEVPDVDSWSFGFVYHTGDGGSSFNATFLRSPPGTASVYAFHWKRSADAPIEVSSELVSARLLQPIGNVLVFRTSVDGAFLRLNDETVMRVPASDLARRTGYAEVCVGFYTTEAERYSVEYSGLPDGEPSEVIERKFDADSEDSDALAFAYAAMGRSSERQWLPEVLHALDHPAAKVRESAALAFGDLADPDDGLGYLETLLDDDELDVQLAAVSALRTIGTSDARAMLTQTIELTSEPDVRERAEEALVQLREDDELHQAVTPEMMESGLYGGGGTAAAPERDLGRYDAPTEEGWAGLGDAGAGQDEDIGEDMEDYYESEEFWRG